jgi:hypothetical protein
LLMLHIVSDFCFIWLIQSTGLIIREVFPPIFR